MPLECEVIPRPDASPGELKTLGAALAGWFDTYHAGLGASSRDVDGWIDREALADLLDGELPQSLALRCASPGMTLTADYSGGGRLAPAVGARLRPSRRPDLGPSVHIPRPSPPPAATAWAATQLAGQTRFCCAFWTEEGKD
jgi:hypothetical protein